MCSIAKESAFQFTNPVLKYLEFQLSEVFSVQPDKETVSVQTKLGLSIKKDDVLPEAIVDLSFELGEKNDNCPFYVHAIETARFKWADNINEETLKLLLNQNAPSLLLSYLRPIIVQITAASQYGAYNIPFMNFT